MKYLVNVLLCFSTVTAESIPETIKLGQLQETLYEQAVIITEILQQQAKTPTETVEASKYELFNDLAQIIASNKNYIHSLWSITEMDELRDFKGTPQDLQPIIQNFVTFDQLEQLARVIPNPQHKAALKKIIEVSKTNPDPSPSKLLQALSHVTGNEQFRNFDETEEDLKKIMRDFLTSDELIRVEDLIKNSKDKDVVEQIIQDLKTASRVQPPAPLSHDIPTILAQRPQITFDFSENEKFVRFQTPPSGLCGLYALLPHITDPYFAEAHKVDKVYPFELKKHFGHFIKYSKNKADDTTLEKLNKKDGFLAPGEYNNATKMVYEDSIGYIGKIFNLNVRIVSATLLDPKKTGPFAEVINFMDRGSYGEEEHKLVVILFIESDGAGHFEMCVSTKDSDALKRAYDIEKEFDKIKKIVFPDE